MFDNNGGVTVIIIKPRKRFKHVIVQDPASIISYNDENIDSRFFIALVGYL